MNNTFTMKKYNKYRLFIEKILFINNDDIE